MVTKVETNGVQQCMKASAAARLVYSILSYGRICMFSSVGGEEAPGISITSGL